MEVVVARAEDVQPLVALRDDLATWLQDRGVDQWIPGEFPREQMRDWVEAGLVHVCRDHDGVPVGAVAVLWEDPDIWVEGADGRAGYIHLLMVDRARAGRGLGDRLLAHAEDLIRQRGRPLARLDAVADNLALHAWYRERGYRPVREQTFEGLYAADWYDSLLFEKAL